MTRQCQKAVVGAEIVPVEMDKKNIATFGAGCFWGVEETFRKLEGVKETAAGYMGGHLTHPSYHDVCTGNTGHAEVVQVEYDPALVTYDQLLDIFWSNHNPTTYHMQGPDIGSQYRSVIFYHSDEQKELAEKSMAALSKSGKFKNPIVTEIVPASTFWIAEEYHQKYLLKNGLENCHI